MRTPEQLKGQIRSFAEKHKLMSQEVLQMYLFERVLERLAASEYKDNFILKGGLLISSMLGINERTTMDMDTTVTGITMNEGEIAEKYETIIRRNIGTTRARDFYDLFRVFNMYKDRINPVHLRWAVNNTSRERGSEEELSEWKEIFDDMRDDAALKTFWKNYTQTNEFASMLTYDEVLQVVEDVGNFISE